MKALVINCTLKASPEESNTEVLAEALRKEGGAHHVISEVSGALGAPALESRPIPAPPSE